MEALTEIISDFFNSIDPNPPSIGLKFRSAKALFVPSLKRDIVPPLHGHDPHGRVAWQPTSDGENSLSRLAARLQRGRSRRARSRADYTEARYKSA
jgi:hypothetical protein